MHPIGKRCSGAGLLRRLAGDGAKEGMLGQRKPGVFSSTEVQQRHGAAELPFPIVFTVLD